MTCQTGGKFQLIVLAMPRHRKKRCERGTLRVSSCDLEHLLDFNWDVRLLRLLGFVECDLQAYEGEIQNGNCCQRRCKDDPGHTDRFVNAHSSNPPFVSAP